MAELLPADLMFEILQRLPVKTLVRFRCVSKGWRDLIDSRNFAKSHLNNLSNRPPSLLVLRRELYNNDYHSAYDVVDLSWVCDGGSPLAFKELPFLADGEFPYYVGQCNGLVCISNHRAGVLLWNPATGKQFQFGLPSKGCFFRYMGFGYENDSDDYRVAGLEKTAGGGNSAWIYSLRSRSWKRIDDFPYSLMMNLEFDGAFVNGALHWRVRQRGSDVSISALHLGKLEYNLVPTPDYSSENIGKYFESLRVLDGRLCVIYCDSNFDDLDLWTMKEYGVKESWTKLIRCASYPSCLIPLAYLEKDEVLLFTTFNHGWNEFKTISFGRRHEIKTRSFGRLCGQYGSYAYVPSLVCPKKGW